MRGALSFGRALYQLVRRAPAKKAAPSGARPAGPRLPDRAAPGSRRAPALAAFRAEADAAPSRAANAREPMNSGASRRQCRPSAGRPCSAVARPGAPSSSARGSPRRFGAACARPAPQTPRPRRPTASLPLEAAPSQLAFLPPPAEPAAALAYSGAIPGPLLRVKKGEELKLRFANRLAEPTTLCFAGLRTPNAVAGYGGLTGPRLAPGASADIRFTPPDPGFNLYLPHAGATDAGQQGRGLFGPIVVDEAEKRRRRTRISSSSCRTGISTTGARSRTTFPIRRSPAAPGGGGASCSPTAPRRRCS